MTNAENRAVIEPREASGKDDVPDKSDTSYLQPLLHRRSRETGFFVRLYPEDRQMFLPFVAKIA